MSLSSRNCTSHPNRKKWPTSSIVLSTISSRPSEAGVAGGAGVAAAGEVAEEGAEAPSGGLGAQHAAALHLSNELVAKQIVLQWCLFVLYSYSCACGGRRLFAAARLASLFAVYSISEWACTPSCLTLVKDGAHMCSTN